MKTINISKFVSLHLISFNGIALKLLYFIRKLVKRKSHWNELAGSLPMTDTFLPLFRFLLSANSWSFI